MFFFNEPATTEIYTYCHTLPLHDALPIGLTADYLNGARRIEVPPRRRKGSGKKLTVHNARANNLQNVTASIPLGTFTCITGVSGRSEEHTSELQSLMRISYAVFCLKKKKNTTYHTHSNLYQTNHK